MLFVPHIFGESLYECMLNAKEFESEEQLKEYFFELYGSILGSFSKDRIIIGKRLKEDERMGMVDPRNVYIKMTDKEKRYNIKDCILIGTCATEYRNINDIINENFKDMTNDEIKLGLRK
jgi:hypothetical protein